MTWVKKISVGLVDLSVHITDFFLERIVDGLGREAFLKHSWTQGITSDKHYCSQLCIQKNPYSTCTPDNFGNETHTHENCTEMINNAVSAMLMETFESISKHRMTITIVAFSIILIMFIRALRQVLSLVFDVLRKLIRWWRTPKEIHALENSLRIMKLELELSNLKALKNCIDTGKNVICPK